MKGDVFGIEVNESGAEAGYVVEMAVIGGILQLILTQSCHCGILLCGVSRCVNISEEKVMASMSFGRGEEAYNVTNDGLTFLDANIAPFVCFVRLDGNTVLDDFANEWKPDTPSLRLEHLEFNCSIAFLVVIRGKLLYLEPFTRV